MPARKGQLARDWEFWQKVDRTGSTDACWPWQGRINDKGHGIVGIRTDDDRASMTTAHRYAWRFAHGGADPGGLLVRHACGVHRCCNPRHLLLGTEWENAQDRAVHARGEMVAVPPERLPPADWVDRVPVGDAFSIYLQDRANIFWDKVDQSAGLDGCWPWTGSRDSDGYGRFTVRINERHIRRAHRAAYFFATGSYDFGENLRHFICDYAPCCNPAHLAAGTRLENAADAVLLGGYKRGEDVPQAVLTEARVAEARRRVRDGETIAAVAREWGLSEMTISRSVRGLTWAHVDTVEAPVLRVAPRHGLVGNLDTSQLPQDPVSDDVWHAIDAVIAPHRTPWMKRDREAVDAIIYALREQVAWKRLPAEMNWSQGLALIRRVRRWQDLGIWNEILAIAKGGATPA